MFDLYVCIPGTPDREVFRVRAPGRDLVLLAGSRILRHMESAALWECLRSGFYTLRRDGEGKPDEEGPVSYLEAR